MKFQTVIDGKEQTFEIRKRRGQITIEHDSGTEDWDYVRLTSYSYSILAHGQSHYLTITEQSDGFHVVINQHTYAVQIKDEEDLLLEQFGYDDTSADLEGQIVAPIPGLISAIVIKQGQTIKKGDKLIILEAMKMENEITSTLSGIIENIVIEKGQSVEKGELLLSIKGEKDGNR